MPPCFCLCHTRLSPTLVFIGAGSSRSGEAQQLASFPDGLSCSLDYTDTLGTTGKRERHSRLQPLVNVKCGGVCEKCERGLERERERRAFQTARSKLDVAPSFIFYVSASELHIAF